MEGLYLVAGLTEQPQEHRIWDLKDIAGKYGSVKGLKVLPHITMIHPFKRNETDENQIIEQLSRLIGSFTPLELHFNGFGYFENPKSHVIYIKVEDDAILQEQHEKLSIFAREKLGLGTAMTPKRFTPHMTIAYRDLDKEKFEYAWADFSQRQFDERMTLESLWLLKHNGLCWIPYEEFKFQGFKNTLF
jgi:2'-5' RNA ligase